jgi:hypothetical protein
MEAVQPKRLLSLLKAKEWVERTLIVKMKKVKQKAAQYESKKSLDGKMKFLKGNVSKIVKPKIK